MMRSSSGAIDSIFFADWAQTTPTSATARPPTAPAILRRSRRERTLKSRIDSLRGAVDRLLIARQDTALQQCLRMRRIPTNGDDTNGYKMTTVLTTADELRHALRSLARSHRISLVAITL